jgi:peptidyl-prolyl cis-trans isomerase C
MAGSSVNLNFKNITKGVPGAILVLSAFFSASGSGAAFAATELAKVNGKAILQADLEASLGGLNEGQKAAVLADPTAKRQALENLIGEELVLQEARKLKLEESSEFKAALNAFTRRYLSALLVEKSVSGKITPSGAKQFYETNRRLFSNDQVYVQHILVGDEMEARKVMKLAGEKGADFRKLAEKFSKDPSAERNRGDVGWINRDSPFVPEFKKAAFDARKGEVVGPIKTSFGFHVIRVVDTKLGAVFGYDEVELKVKAAYGEWLARNFLNGLRAAAKVEYSK